MSTCPCCLGGRTEPLYSVRGHAYVACAACGSARLDPMPPDEPADLYGERYFVGGDDRGGYVDYDADAGLHRRNAAARLRLVAPTLGSAHGADVIDVGCASGYVLDAYRDAGYAAHGVDVSPWAREQAARRGHDVHESLGKAVAACDDLRLVSFFQVLEHLGDPDAALGEAAAALGPGGVVAVETWDRGSRLARWSGTRWQQANPPSVLHLFTRDGMRRLADRHGLDVVALRATSKLVSPALAAGVVAHRMPTLGRPLLRTLQVTGLGRLAVPYKLGDLVTLVAVKR
jgi:SAM-dependent methyltransferase